MFTVIFWKATAERAVKSFVQGFVATGTVISDSGFLSGDSLKGALALAVASLLTSIASSFSGSPESPSLV